MKTVIIYISLLLFSGLIQPFYYQAASLFTTFQSTINKTETKITNSFSFYNDMAPEICPALRIFE
jgi:hypothetical protein